MMVRMLFVSKYKYESRKIEMQVRDKNKKSRRSGIKNFFYEILIQGSEIHWYQAAHTGFLHGHPINDIHAAHGCLVVRYNYEL